MESEAVKEEQQFFEAVWRIFWEIYPESVRSGGKAERKGAEDHRLRVILENRD